MGFEDFISETEAASLAGISVQTLNRFAETGYLQAEVDSDGLRLFSKSQLKELFGIKLMEQKEQLSSATFAKAVNADRCPQSSANTFDNKSNHQATDVIKGSLLRLFPSSSTDKQRNSRTIGALEQEIVRLKNLNDLFERLLDLREQELSDLRRERDWLRNRIEKLEEKSDRDQLLLLSETQALHKLIAQYDKKRSPVRAALAWLGFSEDQSNSGKSTAIEMAKVK